MLLVIVHVNFPYFIYGNLLSVHVYYNLAIIIVYQH